MSAAPVTSVPFKSPTDPAPRKAGPAARDENDPDPEDIHFVEIRDDLVPHVTPGRSRRSPGQLKVDAKVRANYAKWQDAGCPGKETPWLQCPLDGVVVPHKIAEHMRYMIRKGCALVGGENCKPRFGRYNAHTEQIPSYVLQGLTDADQAALRRGHDLIAFTVYVEGSK